MIANATYNSAILTLPDLYANSSLIVGEGFKGCILQGPGILFNESVSNGVVFGPCPMDTKGCKSQSFVPRFPDVRSQRRMFLYSESAEQLRGVKSDRYCSLHTQISRTPLG